MKKLVFITARANYLPDEKIKGNLIEMPQHNGFYILETDKYFVVTHKCMDNSYASDTETEVKHNDVVCWLNIACEYCKNNNHSIDYDDVYLICHDKDVLDLDEEDNRDGVFRNEEALGSLQDRIKDGNIYVFMHSPSCEMFNILISRLLCADEQMVDNAIRIIKNG